MRYRSALGLFLTATAPAASGETLTCKAHVGLNRTYDVRLDESTGDLNVANDAGSTYGGRANKTLSARTGDTTYFLALDFEAGISVTIEKEPGARVALCLGANECYLCKEP